MTAAKRLAHHVLERHPLKDHRLAAPAVEQRLLDREAAPQQADDEVVLVVRTGASGTTQYISSMSATIPSEQAVSTTAWESAERRPLLSHAVRCSPPSPTGWSR